MRGPSRSDSLATDREWTFEVVGSVSRTFALSIDLLEEPVASWVCTGYLLCRTADTVEDDPAMSPRDRADILDTYAAALDPDDAVDVEEFLAAVEEVRGRDGDGDGDTDTDPDRGDDWAVLDCADRTFRVYESFDPAVRTAMREVTREMADGMAGFLRRHADAGGLRLGTVDELEEYCWYVAGTVGKLFTRLLNCYGTDVAADRDSEDARAFALLLQLVNIAKDVRRDYETENNVYLPGEWLAEEGLTHDTVGDPAHAEALARVVERVVDRAAGYAPGARRYLRTVPDEAGLLGAAALPYLLALGTLRELRGHSREAVTGAVRLERAEVEALYAAVDSGLTQAELSRLAEAVRAGPYRPEG